MEINRGRLEAHRQRVSAAWQGRTARHALAAENARCDSQPLPACGESGVSSHLNHRFKEETPDYAPHPPGDLPPSSVHNFALTILGIHLLDRADFDAVSEAAAARNRWEFMLTIAPLRIPRGTGSPVNPIAMF